MEKKLFHFCSVACAHLIYSIGNNWVCIVTRIFGFSDNSRCVRNCISICSDFDIWHFCAISNRSHCWSRSPDSCCPVANSVAVVWMCRPIGDVSAVWWFCDATGTFSSNSLWLKWEREREILWLNEWRRRCMANRCTSKIVCAFCFSLPFFVCCNGFDDDNVVLESFSMMWTLMKLFCAFAGGENGFSRGTLPLTTLKPRPWAFDWCGCVCVASIATSFSAATFNRPIILNCAPAFVRHSDINAINNTNLLIARSFEIFACARV